MHDRRFVFWYYTVSHRMALLRSAGEPNIDIVFTDILYIEMPTELHGIEICVPTPEDEAYICGKIGHCRGIITVMCSGGKRFYAVSAHVSVKENCLSPLELPFDIPCDLGGKFTRG